MKEIRFYELLSKGILQWNINCLRTKFQRLETIINKTNAEVIALQEIKHPVGRPIKIRGYTLYHKIRDVRGGGVLLAVHSNIPSSPITLVTPLEAVACTIHYKNRKLNICNIYFPEQAQIDIETLDK